QFPIQLVSRIILASSNPGDIVFDPFLGSGSTAEAAIRNGRKTVGFEINNLYIDLAIERIKRIRYELENQVEQKSLFELLTDSFSG
ncbi:site-specific DNA-methyltransferase, partial [Limnoraphis robusta]